MQQFPLFANLKGQPCLVVGGGEVASRKVTLLRECGASVTVVAPQLCAALQAKQTSGELMWRAKKYAADDLDGVLLVIAATDDPHTNAQVSRDAQARLRLVNVVDQPALCTFTVPSIVDRAPVTVAVSTGGASPVLARLLRARLETSIPSNYGKLADLLRAFRREVKDKFPDSIMRRHFWENILHGPIAELVFNGHEQAAMQALRTTLNDPIHTLQLSKGEVYLVGAGPGDPDLVTFRALRLMQQADVVLYDRLVTPEILNLCRRDAERIYVGKHRAAHTMRQEDINRTLADLAKKGKRVLRLKGGDPFIFGRGGEEIETLAAEGIPFQVVPGITAAAGCASYAGIPLTHRDYAQSVVFVTGQFKDGRIDLNWPTLVQPQQTVVIYMGLAGLDLICRELIKHGMAREMPMALVERGTTAAQRVIVGTVETLPDLVAAQPVHAPTLLIIGEVVKLHVTLAWFGQA